MIVFGVGASTCGAKCEEIAFRRLTEVTVTTVPAGTPSGAAIPQAGTRLAVRPPLSLLPIRTRCHRSRWRSCPRPFSNRGSWVKLGVKRWSLPGSWFSPGSVARPMMGVRGVTPRGGKRSDWAYAQSIYGLCAVVLTRRPGKDSASAGAELVWRIASGYLLARPPELGTVGPNAAAG